MRFPLDLFDALRTRLTELRVTAERDRGDSPVPTAVIIAGLAIIALALVLLAETAVTDWMGEIPGVGEGPGGDGG
ncbi:hypothetical protein O7627_00790 [Solwaraspora sp. WMMD1047]|uniref:hypothetical protein n=1 Tax=Solwaraspora sp. WMMD1047 TaxID=3016102 RepID=UPI0024161287|nr:hypothetical protein [Solwaraspora sp. WMMD1047]MDG4827836.1 hypothetical protein [Solwaraspora sp. WMMD1047]